MRQGRVAGCAERGTPKKRPAGEGGGGITQEAKHRLGATNLDTDQCFQIGLKTVRRGTKP